MTLFGIARREMHKTSNVQSLQAFRRLIEEREAELVEELVDGANAADVQSRFKELRVIRDALAMPTPRPGVVVS